MIEITYIILFSLILIIFFFLWAIIKYIGVNMKKQDNYRTFFSQNKGILVIIILLILGILYLLDVLRNVIFNM